MDLYIVYQWIGSVDYYFQGVFDSREKAIKACRTDQYCVCPAKLNEQIPDEITKWEGCFYPLNKHEN